jgi:Helicase conserved C-terminal domain
VGLRLNGQATTYVKIWLSASGRTLAYHAARRWGLTSADIPDFYEQLWQLLTAELGLFVADTLRNGRGNRIPDTDGAVQVNADRLRLRAHTGVYRCTTCRRAHSRSGPNDTCMVNRCTGTVVFEREEQDNYDLMVLDERFEMVRPREHSAQIPPEERERIERDFKGTGNRVNTLVCTPTLELGVDIGDLDAVLMRNVPPLPSNYWQRAGRAGRRQRMACNLTYARTASHDRAYFADPMKLS